MDDRIFEHRVRIEDYLAVLETKVKLELRRSISKLCSGMKFVAICLAKE
jgi:hypothetical protein